MRRPTFTGQFKKDIRRMKRRGKDLSKLRLVMDEIGHGRKLPDGLGDHLLKGNWRGRRECHIEPDWLLIYVLRGDEEVVFERTGRHTDLFD
jgi:mRNA interferase YafQ